MNEDQPDQNAVVEDETDPDSEVEQETDRISTRSEKKRHVVHSSADRKGLRSDTRSKRTVKPVLRLTYDEPGKNRDQPLTIVHRGVVIKIGKS